MLGSLEKVIFKTDKPPEEWTIQEKMKMLVTGIITNLVDEMDGAEKMFAKDGAKVFLPKLYKGIDQRSEEELLRVLNSGMGFMNQISMALQDPYIDITGDIHMKLGEGGEPEDDSQENQPADEPPNTNHRRDTGREIDPFSRVGQNHQT